MKLSRVDEENILNIFSHMKQVSNFNRLGGKGKLQFYNILGENIIIFLNR